MANNLSKLDANQVLKSVYNEEANALQITNGAPITPPSGSLEVAIDQSEDSIAIGDGSTLFTGTTSGLKHALDVNLVNNLDPISVEITNPSIAVTGPLTDAELRASPVEMAGEVALVGGDVSVNNFPIIQQVVEVENGILTNYYNEVISVASGVQTTILTLTTATNSKLKNIDVSGDNIATYEIYLDSQIISKKRTYFGGNLDISFNFNTGLNIGIGQVLEVKVTHNRPSVGNFNSNILIVEE